MPNLNGRFVYAGLILGTVMGGNCAWARDTCTVRTCSDGSGDYCLNLSGGCYNDFRIKNETTTCGYGTTAQTIYVYTEIPYVALQDCNTGLSVIECNVPQSLTRRQCVCNSSTCQNKTSTNSSTHVVTTTKYSCSGSSCVAGTTSFSCASGYYGYPSEDKAGQCSRICSNGQYPDESEVCQPCPATGWQTLDWTAVGVTSFGPPTSITNCSPSVTLGGEYKDSDGIFTINGYGCNYVK